MDQENSSRGWIIGAIVLVIVVAGGWWMIKNSKASSTVVGDGTATTTADGAAMADGADTSTATGSATASSDTAMSTSSGSAVVTTAAGDEKLSVEDQSAGASVEISSMALTAPSWIAIKDGKGWILGAGWFPAGATSGTVPLIRGTVVGETYTAVIYVDDGDKAFDFHVDSLVTAAGGTPVSATFKAK